MKQPIIGKRFTFEMKLSLTGGWISHGMEGLNELCDIFFQDQFPDVDATLGDLSFNPVRVEPDPENGSNLIVVEAHGIVEEI